jgi:hypothetical protein
LPLGVEKLCFSVRWITEGGSAATFEAEPLSPLVPRRKSKAFPHTEGRSPNDRARRRYFAINSATNPFAMERRQPAGVWKTHRLESSPVEAARCRQTAWVPVARDGTPAACRRLKKTHRPESSSVDAAEKRGVAGRLPAFHRAPIRGIAGGLPAFHRAAGPTIP